MKIDKSKLASLVFTQITIIGSRQNLLFYSYLEFEEGRSGAVTEGIILIKLFLYETLSGDLNISLFNSYNQKVLFSSYK